MCWPMPLQFISSPGLMNQVICCTPGSDFCRLRDCWLGFRPVQLVYSKLCETRHPSRGRWRRTACLSRPFPTYQHIMLVSPPGSLWADTFLCYCFYIFHVGPCDKGMEQHAKKIPKLVSVLPKAGILIKRSHDSPFEKLEYCIVSGIYNSCLARVQLFSL